MSSSRQFLLGMRDTIPMLVGAVPFGIVYGTLAVSSGLSVAATLAMSLLVFAGSAQFVAASLVASGTSLTVILLTTLIVNLRHLLYSASLLPFGRQLPPRGRARLALWLAHETFAVVHRPSLRDDSPVERKHWYFLGPCLAMHSLWFHCPRVGVLLGQALPSLGDWGLDFA